jgi:hypothetical protein
MPYGIPFLQPQFFRPRQSGGAAFLPTDLSGCQVWLPANLMTGYVDGDPVSLWEDESGNGNDWTQATGIRQPTYETGILNGNPCVRFVTSPNTTFMESSITGTLPATLFAVVIPRATLSGYVGIFSIASGPVMLGNLSGDNKWGAYVSSNDPANTQLVNGTPYALVMSTSGEFYANGAADGTYGGGSTNQPSLIGGMSGQSFEGDVLELAYYSAAKNATEAGQLMSYAASKYGI